MDLKCQLQDLLRVTCDLPFATSIFCENRRYLFLTPRPLKQENSQNPLNYPKQTVPLELYYKSFSSQTRGSRISYTTQLSNSNTKCQSIPCLPLRQACMGRLSMYRSIFPIDRTWTDFETLNLRVWILLVTCLPSPVKILVEAERESWKERRAIVTV